ncbi:MAG: hypothetical protein D6737_15375 [Chloroflexi bacterium]|nr:MAG: hypothetical protein D6737_15375 [Chloroflexota bacterium]
MSIVVNTSPISTQRLQAAKARLEQSSSVIMTDDRYHRALRRLSQTSAQSMKNAEQLRHVSYHNAGTMNVMS